MSKYTPEMWYTRPADLPFTDSMTFVSDLCDLQAKTCPPKPKLP